MGKRNEFRVTGVTTRGEKGKSGEKESKNVNGIRLSEKKKNKKSRRLQKRSRQSPKRGSEIKEEKEGGYLNPRTRKGGGHGRKGYHRGRRSME